MRVKNWTLAHKKTKLEVNIDDEIINFRGAISKLTGGEPPHKEGSTGSVYVRHGHAYYPSVFNLEWIENAPTV